MTIRMKDIAKDLGLSRPTVSKVLGNLPAEFFCAHPCYLAQFSDWPDRSQLLHPFFAEIAIWPGAIRPTSTALNPALVVRSSTQKKKD